MASETSRRMLVQEVCDWLDGPARDTISDHAHARFGVLLAEITKLYKERKRAQNRAGLAIAKLRIAIETLNHFTLPKIRGKYRTPPTACSCSKVATAALKRIRNDSHRKAES